MRSAHLFVIIVAGCIYLGTGCNTPADPETQLETTLAEVDSLLQPPADDSLASDAQVTRADSQIVPVPAAMLDSLFREIASLRAFVEAQETTQDTLAAGVAQTASGDSTDQRQRPIQNQINEVVGGIQHYGWRIAASILVVILFFFVIKGLGWVLDRLAEQSATRRLFFKKLIPVIRILIWIMAVYVILIHIFEVTGTGLLSAWTVVGVAVGFASQEVLKNIFGGLIIIFDQPFQVGDKINIGGTYGEVASIGLRSTRIVTPDDNLVSVPNAQVVDGQVANANAGALDCQVVVDLYLPGWIDVTEAKAIAYSAAANSKYVYLEKPIVVNVKDEFKETFLTHFVVKAYVLDNRYEFAFASDVTETAKAEFQRKGMLPPLLNVRDLNGLENGRGTGHPRGETHE